MRLCERLICTHVGNEGFAELTSRSPEPFPKTPHALRGYSRSCILHNVNTRVGALPPPVPRECASETLLYLSHALALDYESGARAAEMESCGLLANNCVL